MVHLASVFVLVGYSCWNGLIQDGAESYICAYLHQMVEWNAYLEEKFLCLTSLADSLYDPREELHGLRLKMK